MVNAKFEYGFQGVNGIIKKTYYLYEIPNIKSRCDVWDELPIAYIRGFIGINDRNGKEYCFNDVVNLNGGIGVVVWMNDRLGIGSGEFNDYHAIDSVDINELAKGEIIGNIYETKFDE